MKILAPTLAFVKHLVIVIEKGVTYITFFCIVFDLPGEQRLDKGNIYE